MRGFGCSTSNSCSHQSVDFTRLPGKRSAEEVEEEEEEWEEEKKVVEEEEEWEEAEEEEEDPTMENQWCPEAGWAPSCAAANNIMSRILLLKVVSSQMAVMFSNQLVISE